MTSRRAFASRTRPLVLVVAALVALLLATLLIPATPASAGGSGSGNSDQGPPATPGGYQVPPPAPQPPGGGGDANVVCHNGNLGVWKDGKFRVRVYNAPSCTNGPNAGYTDSWKRCTAGFQVFRFYGSEANPDRAATVSLLNKDRYCNTGDAQEQRGFGFWTTSGYDNADVLDGGNYNAENTDAERGVRYKSESADGELYSHPMFKAVWSTVNMTAAKTSYIGVARPYVKMAGAGCADVRQVNAAGDHPIKAFLNDPNTTDAARAEVVQWFSNAYRGMKRQIGPESARKELGIDDIVDGQILWDTTGRCASPIEYTSTTNATDRNPETFDATKNKVTGVCYIPVIREGRLLTNGEYAFDSLRKNAGMRYSTYYTGQPGTEGNWLRADNETQATPGVDWEVSVVQQWRAAVKQWYIRQATDNGTDPVTANFFFNSAATTDQRLPAGPYSNKLSGDDSAQLLFGDAKDALDKALKCRFGSRFAAVKNKDAPAGEPPMIGTVTLNDKYVLHAGGARPNSENVQEFVLSVDATCNAYNEVTQEQCANSKPQITGAGADVEVSMPNGYTICDPRSPGAVADGCDFSVADYDCEQFATADSTAPNACRFRIEGPVNNTKFRLVFYGPTEGTDKVKIGVSNVDVFYTYIVNTGTFLEFDSAWHDFGSEGDWQPHTDTLNVVTVPAKFTPSVNGFPVQLAPDGPGRLAYEAPVIGAVAGAVAGDVHIP